MLFSCENQECDAGISAFRRNIMKKDLFTRGRSLEDAFFQQRDRELIEAMRRNEEINGRRRALSEASGITDPRILDELSEHGLHAEALASLALVPIIEVVWADGHMHPDEYKAVLAAVEKHGIEKNSSSHTLVEHWLVNRPGPKLFRLWKEYVLALQPTLSPEGMRSLKDIVISHARLVAEAAGGFLGIGRVSAEEQAMIKKLEQVFESIEKV
jgi:hypothetical protein